VKFARKRFGGFLVKLDTLKAAPYSAINLAKRYGGINFILDHFILNGMEGPTYIEKF